MRAFARRLADLVWPPACPISENAVDAPGRLAPHVWSELSFLDQPWCAVCGRPFPYAQGEGAQCGPCLARRPLYHCARSPLAYDEASRPLVLGLKHGGHTEMLDQFGVWMAIAGREPLAEADLILPVPLHRRRLFQRRFNQSALLAAALARQTGLRMETAALIRVKPTPSQAGRSASARKRNVAAAFAVTESRGGALAGKRLILVDDVLTTGATAAACVRALKRAGADSVSLITLTRVVRGENPIT